MEQLIRQISSSAVLGHLRSFDDFFFLIKVWHNFGGISEAQRPLKAWMGWVC